MGLKKKKGGLLKTWSSYLTEYLPIRDKQGHVNPYPFSYPTLHSCLGVLGGVGETRGGGDVRKTGTGFSEVPVFGVMFCPGG